MGGSRLLELGQRHHADRKYCKRQKPQPPRTDRHYIRRRLRQDDFWLDSNGERVIYRGGAWNSGSNAGVFSLYGDNSRGRAGTYIGFRAACVRFICDSDTLDDLDSDKKKPEPKKRSILAPDFIGRIKQALARQFQKLYEAAHGEDPEGFAELAEKATAEELTKAAALSTTLAQVNAAVDMYELTAKQLKLAATTSITIKTEVTDHE